MQERGLVAPLSGRLRRLLLALGIAGAVVAVDQWTKSLAVAHLHRPAHLLGPFGLSLGYNSGSAFSLFTRSAPVLAVVSAVLGALLVLAATRARRASVSVGLGLVLGGAVGNLADRLFRGHGGSVVDFITLSHWPTFNVADASITIGAVFLVVLAWWRPLPRAGRQGRDAVQGMGADSAEGAPMADKR